MDIVPEMEMANWQRKISYLLVSLSLCLFSTLPFSGRLFKGYFSVHPPLADGEVAPGGVNGGRGSKAAGREGRRSPVCRGEVGKERHCIILF